MSAFAVSFCSCSSITCWYPFRLMSSFAWVFLLRLSVVPLLIYSSTFLFPLSSYPLCWFLIFFIFSLQNSVLQRVADMLNVPLYFLCFLMVYTPIFHFSAVFFPITFTYLAFPPISCSLLMVLVLTLIPTFSSEKLSIFQMSLIPVVGSAFLIWRKSHFFLILLHHFQWQWGYL